MTVAAGFRFADGLLLCADSEITHGNELKTKGSKIFPFSFKSSGNKAVFTFSGDLALSKMCIQKMAQKLASDPPDRRTLSMMYDSVSEELYRFQHNHIFKIFKHPRYQYGDGPIVDLIIAMWSADDKKLGLYQSSEAALIEVDDLDVMAITGSGGGFARYIARPLVPHGGMGISDLITVATYALKEAKDNVPGCGKGSELITLTKDGEIGKIGWVHFSHVEAFADSFAMAMKHLFVETCDLDATEQQVSDRFQQVWAIIQATRHHLRKEREQHAGFQAVVDLLVQRKTKEI